MNDRQQRVNSVELNKGFVLGEWQVEPLAGRVSRAGHSTHVEPKVMEVLLCLASRPGETVTRETLLQEVWQGVVVSEEVLTRAISELRSLLGDTAREKRYVRTLPKRGYSLIAEIQPLDAALQSAGQRATPAEGTPTLEMEPAVTTSPLSKDVSDTQASGTGDTPVSAIGLIQQFIHFLQSLVKTAGKVALFTVLVGGGLILFGILSRDEPALVVTSDDPKAQELIDHVMAKMDERVSDNSAIPKPPAPPAPDDVVLTKIRTIAVLPFVDLSAAPDHAYFADGVSEDIRNALIGSRDLKVVARTSSRVFKDQALDVREIGRQLAAEVLVEGTVRVQGQQVRVTVQLTDTGSGFPIWAGSFDRSMDNAFAIQREIAQEVASKLELNMSEEELADVNSRAYDKYLLGRHYWHQRTPESLAASRREFSEAIAIQPDYALAYSGLADGYTLGVIYEDLEQEESLKLAQEYVDRALELDPRLAEAHASQGIILEVQKEIKASRRSYERAVQLKPGYSMARMWLGNVLLMEGELNQAYEQYRRALDHDPLHPSIQSNYLSALQMLGRFDEALRLGDQFYSQSRSEPLLKQSLNALTNAGRYDQVLNFIASHNFASQHHQKIEFGMIDALIRLGQLEQAESLLAQYRSSLQPWQLAMLDMELALASKNFEVIDSIAVRVESISPDEMWANKALCENYDMANVARADYWRGLKAYAVADYEAAEELLETANANGGGCWMEPDIELALMLYRADVAGLLNKHEKRNALLHNVEQRIAKMRQQGWGHLPLQVSELVYFILTDQPHLLKTNLQKMNEASIQPLGIAAIDPLMSRHLEFADTRAIFESTAQSFNEMRKRGSQTQLAKFGL